MLRRLTRGRTEKLALLTSRAMEERHDHLRNPAPSARVSVGVSAHARETSPRLLPFGYIARSESPMLSCRSSAVYTAAMHSIQVLSLVRRCCLSRGTYT